MASGTFHGSFVILLSPETVKQARGQALLQDFEEGSIEWQILELLEERVKPFVQQDGGDIEFVRAMVETCGNMWKPS